MGWAVHVIPARGKVNVAQSMLRHGAAALCACLAAGKTSVKDMKAKFEENDKNNDGFLDFDELVVARGQMGHADAEASAKRVIDWWDKDGDKKVTVEEYLDYTRRSGATRCKSSREAQRQTSPRLHFAQGNPPMRTSLEFRLETSLDVFRPARRFRGVGIETCLRSG